MASAPLLLSGGRVDPDFRDALFAASAREGVSVNEFCLLAAAEKMLRRGVRVRGVWSKGDLEARGLIERAA
ncbi:hypothetical protein ACP4J4_20260 (plasmid) [Aureimonas ureilytica]|uniref:hypothetical protein n=1 Tax=Aureimonas ureilytica TaxID=401562 RepID=UPI003CEF6AF0